MASLANSRQEMYAKHRAAGMIPAKAALAAGYLAGSSTTHLEENKEIQDRITELMEERESKREANRVAAIEAGKMVGQLTGFGRAWVLQQLAENAKQASTDGDYKESNRALELIGKEFGMFDGGSADPAGGAPSETPDLDRLNGLLEQADGALPKVVPEGDALITDDQIMQMLEGHIKKVDVIQDRQLTTGSETDVALENDFDGEEIEVDPSEVPEFNPNESFDDDDAEEDDTDSDIDDNT